MYKVLRGDVFERIHDIENDSIQSIITSPPYFNLRDYGYKKQIGLEDNVNDYINKLVKVFELSKSKLKEDGLLFIVINDTHYYPRKSEKMIWGKNANNETRPSIQKNNNYRKSSLMAIPQLLTLELIKKGWIFRQQIIWNKPNCMPESTKSRFTNDYEVILMFSKNENYKFFQLKEDMKTKDLTRPRGSKGNVKANSGLRGEETTKTEYTRNMRATWNISTESKNTNHFATFPEKLVKRLISCSTEKEDTVLDMFCGTGTTLKVANQLYRNSIGIELSNEYIDIAKNKFNNLFNKLEIE